MPSRFDVLADDDSDSGSSDSDESNIRGHGHGHGHGRGTAKKSKHNNNTHTHQSSSAPAPASASASPYVPSFEDLSLTRNDEEIALDAIYGEDFTSKKGAWGYPIFCVKVRPPDIEPTKIGSYLTLHVKLGKEYPFVTPSVEFKDVKGLSVTEQRSLLNDINNSCKELALTGSVMVCELVQCKFYYSAYRVLYCTV